MSIVCPIIYLKDVAALPCEAIVFRKSHKLQNIVYVFTNEILFKLVK